ncbi:hypothetical protein LCM02_08675 [Lutimonas saemankumensis]|uniref:hypothetical protein n=1 Tax=Lutimonas saemankumensis TaxID=483016 RepID=UPI001CD76B62|nr:hypothetical protein [Lutimonas saemankumensis]MCA0932524.1 hypothetical protein [Lutimonas saemankumensis]
MNLLIEKVSDLNDMIMQGEKLEAFDKFYHQEVVMQFNDEDPVKGKVANRKLLELEQKNITELKSAKPLKVTIGEKTTMVEWELNDRHKEFGERIYTQVVVHDWNDGLVIKEKLYCGNKKNNIVTF